MQTSTRLLFRLINPLMVILAGLLLASCQSANVAGASAGSAPLAVVPPPPPPMPPPPAAPPPPPVVAPPAPVPAAPVPAAIRIAAGASMPFTDSAGQVWQADTGFEGGDTTPRDAGMAIANTKDPGLFHNEHYSMTAFNQKLPNGKYTVNLYFAETYPAGISGPGDRVFSINVAGQDFKDIDVWARAGAVQKAYVLTAEVTITDGNLKITFTPTTQNAEINGIEIIPKS